MLADKAVRAAALGEKAYKLADTAGLHLHISTSGRKTWRYKCRIDGKEQLLTPKGMSGIELRYNRAAYMPRRRELAQRWAELIMEGALPADEIVHSPRRKWR